MRIHPPKPPRGRVSSNHGAPVKNPTPLSGSIMPGYVYPSYLGSYWTGFLASTGKLPQYVVLNSGNGDVAWNSDYEALCTSLHALGITVLGYTYTNYGTRTLATVEAAIGNYLGAGITPGGNGVDGIFIDEFQYTTGGVSYYTSLCASIQSQFLAGGGSRHPPDLGQPGDLPGLQLPCHHGDHLVRHLRGECRELPADPPVQRLGQRHPELRDRVRPQQVHPHRLRGRQGPGGWRR